MSDGIKTISDKWQFDGHNGDSLYMRAVYVDESEGDDLGGKSWVIFDLDGEEPTPAWISLDEAEAVRDELARMIDIGRRAEAGEVESLVAQLKADKAARLREEIEELQAELRRLER